MHKPLAARPPVTGPFPSALVLAWVLPLVWLDLARGKSPDRWLKPWPAIPEHAPASNSHCSLDWPSLNRWFCLPSCCFSCAHSRFLGSDKAFAAAKAFLLSDDILDPLMSSLPALAFND